MKEMVVSKECVVVRETVVWQKAVVVDGCLKVAMVWEDAVCDIGIVDLQKARIVAGTSPLVDLIPFHMDQR